MADAMQVPPTPTPVPPTPVPPTQVPPPRASSASAPGGQLDHLAHLHRMSRTAGLGSSEYAAVNVAAVAAVVIGALSALSLATPIFLLLPLVGLVISIIAIRQVISSHGTQTGLLLAIVGLLACLGFAGFTGFQKLHQDSVAAADRREIDQLVVTLGQNVADKKFAAIADMSDARWKEQVSGKALATFFGDTLVDAYGPVKRFNATGLYDIQEDPETHMRVAVGMLGVEAERIPGDRKVKTEIRFRNGGEGWKIYSMPEWFPAPAAPGAAGAAGAKQAPTGPMGPPSP